MKDIWLKKFTSFKEADQADEQYYLEMSPAKRLEIVQQLREMHYKMKGEEA